MARNYVQPGDTLTLPAPKVNMVPGEVYAVGALVGVVIGINPENREAGEMIDVGTVGVYELPKVSADAFAVGDVAFLSATGLATKATGTARLGVVVEAAAAGAATVKVKING